METVKPELEKQGAKIAHQPYSEGLPFIETVQGKISGYIKS
jgi:hypothetical protein